MILTKTFRVGRASGVHLSQSHQAESGFGRLNLKTLVLWTRHVMEERWSKSLGPDVNQIGAEAHLKWLTVAPCHFAMSRHHHLYIGRSGGSKVSGQGSSLEPFKVWRVEGCGEGELGKRRWIEWGEAVKDFWRNRFRVKASFPLRGTVD